ncbi:trafficking protein particle complex subunit 2 isoform X2 [Populus alba x Populus x berolinensis]|nr:trafficking protein particle complex subunit 2 isoform X2 [Populus alba x Populus x berolinensis]
MATTACFIIVSRNDIPIYEAEVGSATKTFDVIDLDISDLLEEILLHFAQFCAYDLMERCRSTSFLTFFHAHYLMTEGRCCTDASILYCMQLLDIVQDLAWTTSAMYLKAIDRFNDMVVSVYVTAGHILCLCDFVCYSIKRFMLLHDSRNDDGIKSFFQEVHELYIKILLNPYTCLVPALHLRILTPKFGLLQENTYRGGCLYTA